MKGWEILKASDDGMKVQWMNDDGQWIDVNVPGHYYAYHLYSGKWRIKPAEPKVIYVNEYSGKLTAPFCGYKRRDEAISAAGAATRTAVKYIEAQE